jgi:hypothetical protein
MSDSLPWTAAKLHGKRNFNEKKQTEQRAQKEDLIREDILF